MTTLLFGPLNPLYAKLDFKLERWHTKNGTKVIFYQAMDVPILDISLAFKAGSALDGDNHGLSYLTAQLMNQGNAGLDANTINEKLVEYGAQYDVDVSRDMAVLQLRTLTNEPALKHSINYFSSIVNQPTFPKEAITREKNQQIMAMTRQLESPQEIAKQNFFKQLYAKHPYAHPTIGNKEHVEKIQPQQIHDFYDQYYVGNNAYLVLVGAISHQKAHKLAEQITNKRPQGTKSPAVEQIKPFADKKQIDIPFHSSQTVIMLGQLGIDHHSKDYFPLYVGNYILGGGSLVSDLAIELREKRGLTYGVHSQFLPMPGIGPFIINFATKNEQAAEALTVTYSTLNEFITQGPRNQALDSAKRYLNGSFQLSLASNRNIADAIVRMSVFNLPEDYLDTYLENINNTSTNQIKSAFQKHINPNGLLQVSVGQK